MAAPGDRLQLVRAAAEERHGAPSHVLRWPGRCCKLPLEALPLGRFQLSVCAPGAQDIPLKEALDSQAASPLPQM